MKKFLCFVFGVTAAFYVDGQTIYGDSGRSITLDESKTLMASSTYGQESQKQHRVQAGETLYAISRKYNCSVQDIIAANPGKVVNNTIKEGDLLSIPGLKDSRAIYHPPANQTSPGKANPGNAAPAVSGAIYHTIAEGETLYSLARRYGHTLGEILSWNDLDPNNITVGQRIIVGHGTTSQPVKAAEQSNPTPINTPAPVRKEPVKAAPTQTPVQPRNPTYDSRPTFFDGPEYQSPQSQTKTIRQGGTTVTTITTTTTNPAISQTEPALGEATVTRSTPAGSNTYVRKDYHIVQQGETLWRIGRMYGLELEDLKAWNRMSSNSIALGQKIVLKPGIPLGGETYAGSNASTARAANYPPATVRNPAPTSARSGASNYKKYTDAENDISGKYVYMKGKGIATWYKGDNSAGESLYALHKDAQMHTIMKVRNPVNGKVIYVKVIGRLPDTDEYKDIAMQLPSAAARKLNMLDERLILEYSYYERTR